MRGNFSQTDHEREKARKNAKEEGILSWVIQSQSESLRLLSDPKTFDFWLVRPYPISVKRVVLCDNHCYHITDEDYHILKRVSPGYARLAKESDDEPATHFVCESCGQIAPIKLRKLHDCENGH